MLHKQSSGLPVISDDMKLPLERYGASCVWNGSSMEPLMYSGSLGWLILSTRSDRFRISEMEMNSWIAWFRK